MKLFLKSILLFLRGGAYKPRTSPYNFLGLGEDGLKILSEVSKNYNLISVTEVVVNPIAKAVLAAGAEGIMVEVHPYPQLALSDEKQHLNVKEFSKY